MSEASSLSNDKRPFSGLSSVSAQAEPRWGTDSTMTGSASPETLRAVRRSIEGDDREHAGRILDAFLPLIQFGAQPRAGLATCKEVLRRRGVIAPSATPRLIHPIDGTTARARPEILSRVGCFARLTTLRDEGMSFEQPARRAVIGGATSRLDLAVAHSLAAQGCGLVLWSRNGERLESVAAEITAARCVAVETIAVGAQDPNSAKLVAEHALADGSVDILVQVDPVQTTAAGCHNAMEMLATTPIVLATALLPVMCERGFGRVLAILSSGIEKPIPNLVYSNAYRSLLASWLKTVSAAVASDGVTVKRLMPGPHRHASHRSARRGPARTPFRSRRFSRNSGSESPAGRYGRPEEFAWLLSALTFPMASYVIGQLISLDGGMRRSL
jgi:3-oxoacyl-[acyl-carrier protein] reductase